MKLTRGNYVIYDGKICTFIHDYIEHDRVLIEKGASVLKVSKSNIKGIELDEFILLQLGFNTDYKKGYIGIDVGNTDFVLTNPIVIGEWQKEYVFEFSSGGVSKFVELKYVHELQNLLFALSNKELTIE